jgi:Fe-S cluster assembly protein SufD
MRDDLSFRTRQLPGEPAWLSRLRAEAEERFRLARWPQPVEEEWRRTDLSGLDLDGFAGREAAVQPAPLEASSEAARQDSSATEPSGAPAGALRFERGRVHSTLDEELRRRGVLLLPLEQALRDFRPQLAGRLEELFRRGLEAADNRFLLWHYSRWSSGALLYVPRFVELSSPVLIEQTQGEEGPQASFPHLTVLLEEGARAELIHLLHGAEASRRLDNTVMELSLGAGSSLGLYEAQFLGPEALYFRHSIAALERDASLHHFDGCLGAGLVKSRIDCALEGPGSEAILDGVFFARDRQHLDLRTVQRHKSPKGVSRANYRGAVRDTGRSVFQGLIEVSPGAVGTDAYLSNKNLLLNEGARADSIPSLKIENNDVRCTHGSTTGRIDEQELFYLMSRGLDRGQATELLVLGYFDELLGKTPALYRERLTERIQALLRPAA